jgi:uncharacterized membrane protein
MLLQQHRKLFRQSTEKFSEIIERINNKNQKLREDLLLYSRVYFASTIFLFLIFIVFISYRIRALGKEIIVPIDQTIKKTNFFVDGDYKVKLDFRTKISELNNLKININSVFQIVDSLASKDSSKKEEIEHVLLRKEYVDVIGAIRENSRMKKQTTVSDLKKSLDITHPTVLSRLDYLKKRDYVKIIKSGREKIISLTSKGEKF